MKNRPNVLTIAGLDPSNGAGLVADTKTFEALKCYGLSVCSANTVQNDVDFKDCYWIPSKVINAQLQVLFARFQVTYVKIGIMQNWKETLALINEILSYNAHAKIIVDPILKSSSHFHLNTDTEFNVLDAILEKIYLLTPNYHEIQQLYPAKSIEDTIKHMTSKTNLLLKGGHDPHQLGQDKLFKKGGQMYVLNPKKKNCSKKHGSGCVLTAAITSYLALKNPLLKACYKGKRYTEKILSSNETLLGYHG